MSDSDIAVILPADGQSSRFQGFAHKKPFVELRGLPVWRRTAEHFVGRRDVAEVVLVLSAEDLPQFRQRFPSAADMPKLAVCVGGASRAESVRNGLAALKTGTEFVAVHDAARPILTASWLDALFAAARQKEAVIPGIPVSSTVKETATDGRIVRTIDRSRLVLAQTPQVFRRTLLEDAYAAFADASAFTDEAALVEAGGCQVYVHPGLPMNIKITTADDYFMAEAFLMPEAAENPGTNGGS